MRAAPLVRLLRVLQRVRLVESSDHDDEWAVLDSVRSAVEMALRTLAPSHAAWAVLLRRYLPEQPDALGRRFGKRARLLRAYALEAALRGAQLTVDEVTPSGVRELVRRRTPTYETDIFEFEVRGLLPWFVLVAEIACRRPISLSDRISAANRETESAISRNYRPEAQHIRRKVAGSWLLVLRDSPADLPELEVFASWVNEHSKSLGSDRLTTLCRLAARTAGWEQFAMDLATTAHGALEASRDQADLRVDSYVTLARAVYAVSVDESHAYFERAVELADRVGSENLERWSALLNLAGTAGSGTRARTAHRLSRVAELTYEHVVRDKHFDWVKTVEALADLSPPSSLAVLSRWRDRRFGNSKRLLPVVIERLVRNGYLPQVAPVVLAGIDGNWDRLDDLKTALFSEKDAARRLLITQVAYRYMRVESEDGALDWSKVSEFATTQGLDLSDLPRLVEADRARKVKAEQQEREREQSLPRGSTPSEGQPTDWNEVFEGVDLLDSDALGPLYLRFRSYDIVETFFREALKRVGVGRRAGFVNAFATLPDFGVTPFGRLVSALSPIPNHLALRRAIHDAALLACRREPRSVVRRGWAAELAPFESLIAQGMVRDEEVAKATADGWASHAEELSAVRLFQVVDPVATLLTPDEADRVLNFGLDLLEDVLKPDGDGPWRVELEPPDSMVDALAGYIWAGLASPVAAERWEHAHVVRSAIELGWRELIEALLVRAASGDGGVFVDQRFEFYAWHARQWLLIGLVRGGKENPAALQAAAPLLNDWVQEDHVVVRQLASQCLRLLGVDGQGSVNQPSLSERVYSKFRLPLVDEPLSGDEPDEDHYFGINIGPYWLGRVFKLMQATRGLRRDRPIQGS